MSGAAAGLGWREEQEERGMRGTSGAGDALLDVRGLSVRYDRADVLADISLSVAHGAVTCVLGPNGAGKSTLLKTIAGALRPRAGSITLAGERLAGRSPPQVVRRGAVLVPEGHRVFDALSVRDNLLAGAATRADRSGIANDLATQFAQFPILRERSGQAAGTLSGGERQMLAIARALMARPRLLMLDEPSLGLAPRKVADVFALIGRLRAQSLGILLVEQNAHQALRIADQVCLLAHGRLVYAGPPGGLAESEALVSAFFGASGGAEVDPRASRHNVRANPGRSAARLSTDRDITEAGR